MPERNQMRKRKVALPDGRYLIFFTFEPVPAHSPESEAEKRETPPNPVEPKS